MASIVGGIGASHSPSIAFAYDQRQEADAAWRPFFDAASTLREQVAEVRPDVLVFCYNDHLWQFGLDLVPTFTIGTADRFALAAERARERELPDVAGDSRLAWHLVERLVGDEFDIATCQDMVLDHGFFSVMPLLCEPPWPMRVVPVAINVIQHPLPTARRCWRLGQAIGRAVRSYDGDARVMVVGTGGLSHQLHGPNFGYTNPQWDQEFMSALTDAPERLIALGHDDYMHRGGAESVEMIVWLVMRGALLRPSVAQRFYHSGLLTGFGLLHLREGPRPRRKRP